MSVVVRSRDEADRLRLTLASLAVQSRAAEIVVVDDGSVDHTAVVLGEGPPVVVVRHDPARGRSAASNAGARAASGDLLIFLDGDTLAGPEMVAAHAAAHAAIAQAFNTGAVGRGETWHLRCTRRLRDPESGTAWTGQAAVPAERESLVVTREQVRTDFAAIARRARPGIYPGVAPERLHALEMAALREAPDCEVLWAAASGSNLSVGRAAFLGVGGFDEALDLSEHRELALRLCRRGLRMMPVEGARTYHMTHRAGWRDPLQDQSWEEIVCRAHPAPAVRLLPVFWAGLADRGTAAIGSLPALEAAARVHGA